MLDANKLQGTLVPHANAGITEEPSLAEQLVFALGIVRRQFLLVIILTIAGLAAGSVVLLKSPSTYTASATLLVDTRKIEILQQPTISNEISMQSIGALESQVALLKSDAIASTVINKLKLLDDPRFVGSGRPGALATMLKRVAPFLFPERPRPTKEQLAERGLYLFEKSLTAERIGVTYAIEIQFEANYPDLAADVANAVAEAYIDLQRTSAYEAGRRASDWLEGRMPELRAKSEAAQRAVVEYKTEHNIVETGSGRLVDNQRVDDLLAKLNAARDETARAKAKLDRLAASNGIAAGKVSGPSDDKDQQAALFDKLQSEYFEVASKEADAMTKYGANNPTIISLHNQKAQLQNELNDEFQRIKEAAKSDYAFLQTREAEIQKEYDTAVTQSQEASHAQVKLRELEASATAYQDLYNTFVNRYSASLQEAASPVAQATVISPASPLIPADRKKTLKVAAMFPLAGLMLGLGLAFMRELLGGRVFRTSKSVQSRLRIPCIGLLPAAKESSRLRRRHTKPPISDAEGKFIVRGDMAVCWTVVDHPFSRFSEGVRSIKLAIELDNRSRASKVIGFTSANPNEGKSTVSLATAQLLARNGARVIIVDCDLRNPSLTRSVAPRATKGIAELLRREISLENVVWKDRSTELTFLPAIPFPGPPDPPTILSSDALKVLFEDLRDRYDYVVVDLSPLAPVVDVCATTEFIDAYILVIEWGRTTTDAVQHALRAAPGVSELLAGAVLNKANIKELASYDPYLTSYYFDQGAQHHSAVQ